MFCIGWYGRGGVFDFFPFLENLGKDEENGRVRGCTITYTGMAHIMYVKPDEYPGGSEYARIGGEK